MTLDELKQTTIRENGYTAKINSFDDYLAAAEKTHQRLLIEIKTTKRDSKDMVNNFATKYGPRLRKINLLCSHLIIKSLRNYERTMIIYLVVIFYLSV
ncbi:hypothetical protein ACG92U_02335 [Leuconostoc citreum]